MQFQQMRSASVRQTLVELSWARAEPTQGVFDESYLRQIAVQVDILRAAGFDVALNTGIQTAPAWLLAMPGARYVDQYDVSYTAEPLPNLVFGTNLRVFAQTYLREVFGVLGTDFSLVRAGGGHFGELGYPFLLNAHGKVQNLYWSYDVNASKTNPAKGWIPGMPAPRAQAAAFLSWYLNALDGYQNWQVSALRDAGFRGWVAMLYPSFGMRPGDAGAAISDDLDGSSSAEINGEVQRGYDSESQIAALEDKRVVVYGTWAEQPETIPWLASLAAAKHLPVMAENSGGNSTVEIESALSTAASYHAVGFFLYSAPGLLRGNTGTTQLALLKVPRGLD